MTNVYILNYNQTHIDSILLYDANTTLEIFSSTKKQKLVLQIQRLEHLATSHILRYANLAAETKTELENVILVIYKNSWILLLR